MREHDGDRMTDIIRSNGQAIAKACPDCGAYVPIDAVSCPMCARMLKDVRRSQMHGAWHQRDMSTYLLDILRNERASISPFRDRAVDLDIAEVFPEEDEHIDPVDDAIEIISKDEQARRSAVIMRQEREVAAFLEGFDRRGREAKRRYYAHSPGSEAREEAGKMNLIANDNWRAAEQVAS